MTPLPKDLIGTHPFVDWCRKILAGLRERTVLAGPGIGVSYEKGGTRIWSKGIAGNESAVSIRWRGEWTDLTPADGLGDYVEGDVVIRGSDNSERGALAEAQAYSDLQSGLIAGTYIALRDSPSTDPASSTANSSGDWAVFSISRFPIFSVSHRSTIEQAATAGNAVVPQIVLASKKSETIPIGQLGRVVIDLNACFGEEIGIREVEVCMAGNTKYMLVLASLPYDTRKS